MPFVGEEYERNKTKLKVEIVEFRFDASGKRSYIIGYRIIDGHYTSPIGYIWVDERESYHKLFDEIIDRYREVVDYITKM